jgi:hypothetical protein
VRIDFRSRLWVSVVLEFFIYNPYASGVMRRVVQRRLAGLEVFLVLFLVWHAHGAHLLTPSHQQAQAQAHRQLLGQSNSHQHRDFKVLKARQMAVIDHCAFCLSPSLMTAQIFDSRFAHGESALLTLLTRAAFTFEASSVRSRAPPG